MAQEKSSRSLMFTLSEVFCRTAPVCSAMDMKRLLNSSSITGSTRPVSAVRALARCSVRRRIRWFSGVTSAVQPGSTTVVALASRISAGPRSVSPASRASRSKTGASAAAPSTKSGDGVEHGGRLAGRAGGEGGFLHRLAGGGHLGDAGLDHQLAFRGGEAEALAMRGGEGGDHRLMRAEGDGQEAVGAGIAQVQPAGGGDARRPRRPGGAARRGPPPPARPAGRRGRPCPRA